MPAQTAESRGAPGHPAAGQPQPTVFLHVGEPKTGTTFVQEIMWGNKAELMAMGVTLPGHHLQEHYRASQDLRGLEQAAGDPAGPWDGEWDLLARRARQAGRVAVISHELFSAVDEEQAARAVASLQPAEVHVVVTVRDMGSLLPAEWQESIKHRSTRRWEDWLEDVTGREFAAPDRRQYWFWRVHDTLEILRVWARHLPPRNVHVITMPPASAGSGLLWQRFASLIEVDPGRVNAGAARPNASLGLPEVEFLRRLNQALPEDIPDWYYMTTVKEIIAHDALAARPRHGRLALPPAQEAWAQDYAKALTVGLAESGYDVIGDPAELMPRPADGVPASPSRLPAEQVLDAAVGAASGLVVGKYWKDYPSARPRDDRPLSLAERVEVLVAASPLLKRTVRELSVRSRLVRELRFMVWAGLDRAKALQRQGGREGRTGGREGHTG